MKREPDTRAASSYSTAITSHKSVVKVEIPHCRGRWSVAAAKAMDLNRYLRRRAEAAEVDQASVGSPVGVPMTVRTCRNQIRFTAVQIGRNGDARTRKRAVQIPESQFLRIRSPSRRQNSERQADVRRVSAVLSGERRCSGCPERSLLRTESA